MEGLVASAVLIAVLLGVLLVVVSIGGLVYLFTRRLRKRGQGPALAEYRRPPTSPVGHAVAVVAISGVVYLVLAGKALDAAGVMVVLVIIEFIKSTAPQR